MIYSTGMMFEIPKPDDYHIHLRQEPGMKQYIRDCGAVYNRMMVMPNTVPPVCTPGDVRDYRDRIIACSPDFNPLMTFMITPGTKVEDIRSFSGMVTAGKYYPKGATTNSDEGVSNEEVLYPVFAEMERCGIPLSVHGEDPGYPVLEREKAFLPRLSRIAETFPSLQIVLEHVSTQEGVRFVRSSRDGIAGTITVHHLLLTLDDVIGGAAKLHHFCKPVVKTREDRDALREAVFSGDSRFFFGSDSAPHPLGAKQKGAAGIYSSPLAIPLLADLFHKEGYSDKLAGFVSRFGAGFYGLEQTEETICLEQRAWTVPETYGDVIPLLAGTMAGWSVVY